MAEVSVQYNSVELGKATHLVSALVEHLKQPDETQEIELVKVYAFLAGYKAGRSDD